MYKMGQGGDGMTPALIAIIVMPFIVLVFAFCFACRSSYKSESRPIHDIVEILRAHKTKQKTDQENK